MFLHSEASLLIPIDEDLCNEMIDDYENGKSDESILRTVFSKIKFVVDTQLSEEYIDFQGKKTFYFFGKNLLSLLKGVL